MENKLKKLLIGFFIMMAFFTVVSKAAASVMVARVQVAAVKDSELSYKVSGTGIIKENAEKYMDLYSGLKVGRVSIEGGQQIEKGDLLFEYDTNQLKEKASTLENELKKMQLQYDKAGLSSESADGLTEVKTAELAKETAEVDLKAAKQALKDMKIKVGKDKKNFYKEAVTAWEEVKDSGEEAKKDAKRAVLDAESELEGINEPITTRNKKIEAYKYAITDLNEDDITKAYTEVFDFYYNGTYKEHLEERSNAEVSLKRAEEDLTDIIKKWNAAIDEWDKYSSEESVQKAYEEQISAKNAEIKNGNRAIADAQKSLNKLSEPDNLLSNALNNYKGDIERNDTVNMEGTYAVLYEILSDKRKVDDKQVFAAESKLARAKEDEEQIKVKWEQKLKEAAEKKDKLFADLEKIKNGSYNYEEELKEGEKEVKEAERALQSAELSLSQAEAQEQLNKENKQVQNKSKNMDLDMLKIDIDEKQAEIDRLTGIIANKGKVSSPSAGVIIKNDLVQGTILTGQEKLIIATGGYELYITAGKEDIKPFSVGDELQITINSSNDKAYSVIENIDLPDQDGNVSFTALLPEGDYNVGGSLEYDMQKESQSYPKCIPVQALRQDSKGTFVLLVKEKDSVLGKEENAFRMDVTVVIQDDMSAAIEASLSKEDQIILSSNKNISEGDRVRIYEME